MFTIHYSIALLVSWKSIFKVAFSINKFMRESVEIIRWVVYLNGVKCVISFLQMMQNHIGKIKLSLSPSPDTFIQKYNHHSWRSRPYNLIEYIQRTHSEWIGVMRFLDCQHETWKWKKRTRIKSVAIKSCDFSWSFFVLQHCKCARLPSFASP